MPSPTEIAAKIEANVDAFWNRSLSYEDFHAEAGRLWKLAESLGVAHKVSQLLPITRKGAA